MSAVANEVPSAAPARAMAVAARRFGEVILEVSHISLAFGGVKALSDISFEERKSVV